MTVLGHSSTSHCPVGLERGCLESHCTKEQKLILRVPSASRLSDVSFLAGAVVQRRSAEDGEDRNDVHH